MPALFPRLSRLILRQSLRALLVWALIGLAFVLPTLALAKRDLPCADVCSAPVDGRPF